MYRSVVKRLPLLRGHHLNNLNRHLFPPPPPTTAIPITHRFLTDSIPQPISHTKILPQQNPENDTLTSETARASKETVDEIHSFEKHSSRRKDEEEQNRQRVGYQDEQARVLQSALPHVHRLGWSEAAIISGAKEVGISPSIVGSFPRKEAALVEFFMDDCLQRLIDKIESEENLRNLMQSDRIVKLIQIRLEMQEPYISKWAQALSIQVEPINISTSFKQRAVLIDEIWHASGDHASDIDWYLKRAALGGIYSAAEVYMLTDNSPNFRETWTFLKHRVKDAFDLGKTVQEVKYLAEAVGAGIGNSFQGIMKGMSQS